MNNENLQKWALLAEIVGGIAVVLSLIFVGIEVSQTGDETALNTKAVEASAYQNLIQQISDLNLVRMENAELRDILRKAREGENQLSIEEQEIYGTWRITLFRHADMAYYQYELGIIDERRLISVLGIVLSFINSQPGAMESLKRSSTLLPEFKEYMEALAATSFDQIEDDLAQ